MRIQSMTDAERHTREYGDLVLLAGNTSGLMRTRLADLKIISIRPSESTSFHRHLVAESIFHVLSGRLLLQIDKDQTEKLGPGDTFIVEPGEPHRLNNIGHDVAKILEVESPPHDSTDKYSMDGCRQRFTRERPLGRFWNADSRVHIKVCGVRSLDSAYNCLCLGVHAIGIHALASRAMERLRAWSEWLSAVPSELSIFLLSDAQDIQELVDLARWSNCDTVQLQGHMPAAVVRAASATLREGGWKIVKSVGLGDLGYEALKEYACDVASCVDAVLIDSSFRGGTGQLNDWTLCRALQNEISVPLIVAGGIRPTNVSELLQTIIPFGVDVESGVEIALKARSGQRVTVRSHTLIEQLVNAVQGTSTGSD